MGDRPRRIFVAGSTGATGRTVLRLAKDAGVRDRIVAHVRPRSAHAAGDGTAVCDLSDATALGAALKGMTTVVQLIGTVRKRFASGDTYESSDIGTTRSLVQAARTAGVEHIVLLSAVGAGRPIGAYLRAKASAEELVVSSGIAHSIFRPSVFISETQRAIPGSRLITRLLHLRAYEPIELGDLAAAILRVALDGKPLGVLEGKPMWDVVDASKQQRSAIG
jgi:uncharacterized protein YbjT (DUF2867 family)